MNKRIDEKNRGRLCFKGFTLIELLVVIAIIALLLAILIPALKKVKRKAATAVCLTNTKNLSLGWFMYQEANDGFIVGGSMDKIINGTKIGWIRKPRTADGAERNWWYGGEVTDEDEIRGIRDGSLFPYLKSPKILHCPADNIRENFFYPGDRKSFASYAVPACLNGTDGYGGDKVTKFGKIRNPSAKYNFVETAEERPYNGQGQFLMFLTKGGGPGAGFVARGFAWKWWSPLAVNHGDSSTFGFCDGHGEVRKWRDEYTIFRANKLLISGNGTYGHDEITPAGQIDDIGFMARGWTLGY